MPFSPEQLPVAYHEVGHAIVAHELGLYVENIKVKPGFMSEGEVDAHPKDDDRYIAVLYAGAIAHVIHDPNDWASAARNSGDDCYKIGAIAVPAARKRALRKEAKAILLRRWAWVESLVAELERRKSPELANILWFCEAPKLIHVLERITGKLIPDPRPHEDAEDGSAVD